MSNLPQDVQDFLEQTVRDYMRQAGMFTSLDITNLAKDEGYRVRNHQVAEWLRCNAINIAANNSYMYNQSLITVDSHAVGVTKAYLYHHYMDDTDEYLDRDQNPKSFQSPTLPSYIGSPQHFMLSGRSQPHTPAPAPTAVTQYFPSREKARDFARAHSDICKFKDNGPARANIGERWSCVPR